MDASFPVWCHLPSDPELVIISGPITLPVSGRWGVLAVSLWTNALSHLRAAGWDWEWLLEAIKSEEHNLEYWRPQLQYISTVSSYQFIFYFNILSYSHLFNFMKIKTCHLNVFCEDSNYVVRPFVERNLVLQKGFKMAENHFRRTKWPSVGPGT